jgi:predicted RNase H-like HicB family nuclease
MAYGNTRKNAMKNTKIAIAIAIAMNICIKE